MTGFYIYPVNPEGSIFYVIGNCSISYHIKTLREDAHSCDKKMSFSRPRSAREFRERTFYSNLPYYLLMFCKIFFCKPYDSAGQKEDTD